MSDTAPRNASAAPRLLADALLRTAGGTTALLRMVPGTPAGAVSEVGLVPTTYADVVLSPAVMRKLQPGWREDGESIWELLVSATSVEQQAQAMDLASAKALFAQTTTVTVAGQDYLIDSIAANEAFGQVYVYRLRLREARDRGI